MIRLAILRRGVFAAALAALSACGMGDDPDAEMPPMGDFRLGYAIVVDRNAQTGPLSREAEPGEWEAALKAAITRRLGRYEGGRFYHVAANVNAYVLAVPGVPVIASPKSILSVTVNLWDDATGTKINPEPREFTLFEDLSGSTVIGSGLTQSRERQIENLSAAAARAIHNWLLEHPEWFARPPEPGSDAAAAGDARMPEDAVTRPAPRPSN
jgi:hypothetical protein